MLRAGMLATVVLLVPASSAHAATYTVSSGADSGAGTLRQAILDANTLTPGPDEIVFTTTPVLPTAALPDVTDTVTINGSDAPGCTGTSGFVGLDGNDGGFDGLRFVAGSENSRLCRISVRDFSDGIEVIANGVTIEECRVGTTAPGDAEASNGRGIFVNGASNTRIDECQISGNTTGGVILHEPNQPNGTSTGNVIEDNLIGLAIDGSTPLQNFVGVQVSHDGVGVLIGGTDDGDGNVISGNQQYGVSAVAGTIKGNYIGTDINGATSVPNGSGGVGVLGDGVVVGEDTMFGKNVIGGGSNSEAVYVDGEATIVGNWIGLTQEQPPPTPYAALAGQEDGVIIADDGDGTRVEDNVIAGHVHYGVWSQGIVDDLVVRDNVIGLLPDGVTVAVGDEGIDLDADTTDALIEGNTIAGNGGAGIEVAATNTTISGNTFGRDTTGAATAAAANDEAIDVIAPADATAIEANRISNSEDAGGVQIWSGSATLEGNLVDANDRAGVWADGPVDVRIGGATAASENEIAGNGDDGVEAGDVDSAVEIGRNSIHDNGTTADDLGIDVGSGGVTGFDTTDGFQDFPELTSAATRSSDTDVAGTVLGVVGHDLRIDVFASTACDTSGNGEGAEWLGSIELTATGTTSFAGTVGGSAAGRRITAVATDLDDGRSSEFSECFTATQKPEDPSPDPGPTQGETPPPEQPAPLPPIVAPPPISLLPAPKFPAKVAVLRNGVDDGFLDMLIQITSRAETRGAELELDYQSSGRHTRFDVPIDGTQIRVRKKLPKSQPKDTGIVEIAYDGNDAVSPDEVRLRAADGKSLLKRTRSEIEAGRLFVEGTVAKAAEGVVRIRLEHTLPDGSTGFLFWNAKIAKGKWKIAKTLPSAAAAGGQLSIQFTGYEKENLRGEQIAKQVLA